MRLIKPSFEIWEQEPGLEGIYKQIEKAARICYKSENNIKEGSAEKMVNALIKNQHTAMLEHGTVYLLDHCRNIGNQYDTKFESNVSKYKDNKYSVLNRVYIEDSLIGNYYFDFVTTNLRVLVENDWLNDLKYLCEPTEHHEKRITVKFITSIGITRELIRHRKFSFANESTRYCNYNKHEKFGQDIIFIQPTWWEKAEEAQQAHFSRGLKAAESLYNYLIAEGRKAQDAREVLPLATKSEIVMTGFVEDWEHFFRLRTSKIAETGKPHPDASALADPLYEEFVHNGYTEPLV